MKQKSQNKAVKWSKKIKFVTMIFKKFFQILDKINSFNWKIIIIFSSRSFAKMLCLLENAQILKSLSFLCMAKISKLSINLCRRCLENIGSIYLSSIWCINQIIKEWNMSFYTVPKRFWSPEMNLKLIIVLIHLNKPYEKISLAKYKLLQDMTPWCP